MGHGPDEAVAMQVTPMYETPPPSSLTEDSKKALADPDITVEGAAKIIHDKHNIVLLMILNEGYIAQGKSWVCNVKSMPGNNLDKTLIVATDRAAYDSFKAFNPDLHIAYHDAGAPAEMTYGQVGYWKHY